MATSKKASDRPDTDHPKDAETSKAAAIESPADSDAPRLDETVPGGRYRVGDKWVNAHGKEIK